MSRRVESRESRPVDRRTTMWSGARDDAMIHRTRPPPELIYIRIGGRPFFNLMLFSSTVAHPVDGLQLATRAMETAPDCRPDGCPDAAEPDGDADADADWSSRFEGRKGFGHQHQPSGITSGYQATRLPGHQAIRIQQARSVLGRDLGRIQSTAVEVKPRLDDWIPRASDRGWGGGCDRRRRDAGLDGFHPHRSQDSGRGDQGRDGSWSMDAIIRGD
jgi:hypothetical protein